MSLGHADLLISADRTRFSVRAGRLASEGLAPNQDRFTHRAAISAHSCLPEQSNRAAKPPGKSQVQFHERAAGVIARREETQSAASAYREAELDLIKLTMQSPARKLSHVCSWRGSESDALT